MLFRLLLIVFLLYASALGAQERVFKFFNIQSGLPSNNIFKIRFDPKGFLWIAHDKGISRYDGNTFRHYSSPEQKSNVYTDVFIAPDGKVWMSNIGMQAFYIENDEMKLFRSFGLKQPPATLKIGFLSNGNLVFNAEGGIAEINPRSGEMVVAQTRWPVQGFYQSNDTLFLMNSNNSQLLIYHRQKLDSTGIRLSYPPLWVKNGMLFSAFNVSKALDVYHLGKKQALAPLALGYNYNYSEECGNKLLVFTNGNIRSIEIRGDSISNTEFAKGHRYTHYAKDKLGNEWFSTLNEGILFLPAGNCQRLGPAGEDAFVKLVEFRNQAYTISTSNRLYSINGSTLNQLADLDAFFDYKPIILMKNLDDRRLVIGHSRFLALDSLLQIRPYLNEVAMKDICTDNGRNIYLATSASVFFHSARQDVFEQISRNDNVFREGKLLGKLPVEGRYHCVAFDSSHGSLYFGGIPGFFIQKADGKTSEIKDLGASIYTTTLNYSKPYLLAGTIQSGIYVLRDGVILRHLHSGNSTLGNTIIKIKQHRGVLWALSEKGLHEIEPLSMRVRSYTNAGAIGLENCSDFTISGDLLYLISGEKIYSVALEEFVKSIKKIPVYFLSASSGKRKIFDLKDLQFAHDENNLIIRIEIPAAMVLGNVEFEYRLNNSQWYQLSKGQTEINLNQLRHGRYTLWVRQKGMSYAYAQSFIIEAPFWLSWWFIALSILLAFFLFVRIYLNRVRAIREKSSTEIEKFKLEKALQQNILSSIQSQMNPHFLFNALNTIQSYIYLNDKEHAIDYLGKFSDLTRRILEQSNQETITLGEEHETLLLYLELEKMRFEDTFNYQIRFVHIPFKDQIRLPPMLIQPYIENAIKHGLLHKAGERRLEILFSLDRENNCLKVSIDDNGIGRKRAGEIKLKRGHNHKPFSTEANKTRLEILNRDKKNPISVKITDKSDNFGNPTGTLVQIQIPVL